jgi:hypothetical protein
MEERIMNIFALSKNPEESAQQLLDKHIIKMPTETCQMLHTNITYILYVQAHNKEPSLAELKAFHKKTGSELMKPAMLNHPSTIWGRQSIANFYWLYQHGMSLCEEYTYRYDKIHGSQDRIIFGMRVDIEGHSFPNRGLTPVTIAMDDSFRLNEKTYSNANPNWTDWDFVIASYRHYYLEGKWRIAEWRKDRRPNWFPANWFAIKHNRWAREYNSVTPRKYPMNIMEE